MSRKSKSKGNDMLMSAVILIALFLYLKTKSIAITSIVLICLSIMVLGVTFYFSHKSKLQLKMSGIDAIDKMDGLQFEQYLKLLFEEHGYKAAVTQASCDYGADLVISKEGIRTVVQAKRYQDKVGIKAVQEILGAISFYDANKAMVITNSKFTKAAQQLALSSGVELIDRSELIKMLSKFNAEGAKTTPAEIRSSSVPVCDKCHVPMVIRNGKRGQFYGCKNYPRCRETRPL